MTLYKLKYLRCVVEATEKIYWFLSNVPDTIVVPRKKAPSAAEAVVRFIAAVRTVRVQGPESSVLACFGTLALSLVISSFSFRDLPSSHRVANGHRQSTPCRPFIGRASSGLGSFVPSLNTPISLQLSSRFALPLYRSLHQLRHLTTSFPRSVSS